MRRRLAATITASTLAGAVAPLLIFATSADAFIYWGNLGGRTISRANNDGSGVVSNFITVPNGNPSSIAVYNGYIYWGDYSGHTIGRANLDGTGVNQTFIQNAGSVCGVAVDSGGTSAGTPYAFAKTVLAKVVSGTVSILEHGKFVPLTGSTTIPVGSILDTRSGTIGLTTSTPTGAVYSGQFNGAEFQILQPRAAKGLTNLRMIDSLSGCRTAAPDATTATATPKIIATLHAHAHGRFRTTGRFASATVRGTIWDTIDRCDGTLTTVHQGTVVVFDFHLRRSIVVTAGKSYLAKP